MFKTLTALIALLISSQLFASEYLVKYRDMHRSADTLSMNGLAVYSHNDKGRLFKIDVPERSKARTLAKLLKDPAVEYVVPNFKLKAYTVPVQIEALKEQWALAKVNAEKAWKLAGKGNRKVIVAVIDTGTDYNHEALKPNMVPGYNFKDNNNDPMDKTGSQNPGHGTHVAGIVGATGLVDNGIVGISPEVSIMPLRFLGEDGSGDLNSAIAAIDYAIEKKVDIIQASWGATVPRSQATPLIEAVKRADDAGIIFIAAAANDGSNNDTTDVFPANAGHPNTITVAASGPNDEKPQWSNYGVASVHVAAPGLDIMSTLPKNTYGKLSGTSMATPLVSGLVALIKSQDSKLTGQEVRALLQTSGAKVSIETACHCRVDAAAAIEQIQGQKLFVAPNATTIEPNGTQQFHAVYGKAPFTFSSSNESVAKIDANGLLTATGEGETTVTVKDSTGASNTSLAIRVAKKEEGGGGGGGFPWPPGGDCPLGDEQLCQIICQIQPDLPFCKK